MRKSPSSTSGLNDTSSPTSLTNAPAATATSTTTTTTSPTTPSIPEDWIKILEIVDEAHLPHNLPVRWPSTQDEHEKVAFNPNTNEVFDLKKNVFVKRDKYPVRFITLTKGQSPMPGTDTPAAVRYERYMEGELNKHLVQDERHDWYAPCITHGDYVKVESLQADHLQAKAEILRRQQALVKKLNDEPSFAAYLMQHSGMEKFFVRVDEEYFGTLFFYELYFNDIDNIWLICQACNLQKSDDETIAWLKNQWLYGEEFLDYLSKLEPEKNGIILDKVKNKEGLAQVAIDWFWERHANYVSVTKRILEEIKTPLQILNCKVDRVIGIGNLRRAERLRASLNFKIDMLQGIAQATGLGMPKSDSESSYSSSDEEARLEIIRDDQGFPSKVLLQDYITGSKETANKTIRNFIPLTLHEEVLKAAREREAQQGKKRTAEEAALPGSSDNTLPQKATKP